MATLYAFCREVDDVADDESVAVEERRRRLAGWREDVRLACETGRAEMPVNRELVPVIARYGLPFGHFDELLRGVEMDLDVRRYASYAEMELYCYRVASVVGLLSIEIFGYRDARCREYAVFLGKALQYTNILRDVGNDAARGRIYLPQEALRAHGVSEEDILAARYSESFEAVAAEMADRARGFYGEARRALPDEDRKSMVAAELMGSVYWRLLCRLRAKRFQVLAERPIRLSKTHKGLLVLRAWLRFGLGIRSSDYGC